MAHKRSASYGESEGRPSASKLRSSTSERTPLLSGHQSQYNGTANGEVNGSAYRLVDEEDLLALLDWRAELWVLTKLALPMWATHLLEYSITGITILVVGHLGTKELAAASIASLLITTTTTSLLIYGLTGALDTLAPQAYTSTNPKTTSLYVQRTGVLLAAALIPACIALSFGEKLLLLLKQDPYVAKLAGQYIQIYLFGVPFLAAFELCRRWLQAQGLVSIPTLALVLAAPTNILLNWALVLGPEPVRIGFLGAPIATVITHFLNFAVIAVYCVFFAPRDAWGGWTMAMFQDLGPNIKLGLSAAVSVVSEWWSWDLVSFASSYLGASAFAANQVALTLAVFIYQLPYSISMAIAIRIGNLLGAQNSEQARFSARIAWIASLALGIINSAIVLIFRHNLARAFTDEEEVLAIVAEIIPYLAVFQIMDDLSACTYGILRGTGLTALAARANIAAYWLTGIPAGLILTFRFDWGLNGLWLGHVIALTTTALLNSVFSARIDWPEMERRAKEQADNTDALLKAQRHREESDSE